MIQAPIAQGLIFCKRMVVDPTQPQVSLEGVFTALHLRRFPTPLHPMTIYAALADGDGEGELAVRIYQTPTQAGADEIRIYSKARWVKFEDRLQVQHFEFIVRQLRFPEPGTYIVWLTFAGLPVTERRLVVYKS